MPLTRRKFLLQAALASCAGSALFAASPPAGKPRVVLEQSGSRSTSVLVFGVLAVANPAKHLLALRDLRAKHKYRRALRHRNLDESKVPYGSAVIDYFLASDDFHFAAVVLKQRGATARKRAIIKLTTAIREHGGLQVYEQDVPNAKPWKKGTNSDNLRQLADILTGAVYVDATHNTNELRTVFAARLREKLKVKRLDVASLSGGKRFLVVG